MVQGAPPLLGVEIDMSEERFLTLGSLKLSRVVNGFVRLEDEMAKGSGRVRIVSLFEFEGTGFALVVPKFGVGFFLHLANAIVNGLNFRNYARITAAGTWLSAALRLKLTFDLFKCSRHSKPGHYRSSNTYPKTDMMVHSCSFIAEWVRSAGTAIPVGHLRLYTSMPGGIQ